MKNRLCQLEFGVACLGDIRVLLKVWQRVLTLEGLEDSQASLVHVAIEDRRPGEEVMLVFQADQGLLNRFLSTLTDAHFEYVCRDLLPGLLTLCRATRDRGGLKVIGEGGQGGPGKEGNET
jgi:hypothetical protein